MIIHKYCSFNNNIGCFTFKFCALCFSFTYFIFKIVVVLTHTHTLHCRSSSTLDLVDNNSAIAIYDFENPIYQSKDEGEEDCEVPGELSRLLQQEEREIQPHEELVKTVNLGTEEDKKEVKIGANLEHSVKEHLIQMLHDYIEIFSW